MTADDLGALPGGESLLQAAGIDLDALFFSQNARLLSLQTALPAAVLIPTEAQVSEAVDAPFVLTIHAIATSAGIDPRTLIGQQITLRLRQADGRYRPWHGIVFQAQHGGGDGGVSDYRLVARPWLSLLDLRRDAFVFQDKTALEIIEAVFKDYPQAHWRVEASAPLRRRSLCIQYRESDLAFVTRLLAEEGLSYHFEHLDDAAADAADSAVHARHVLVIGDPHSSRAQLGAVRCAPPGAQPLDDTIEDTLMHVALHHAAQSNAATVGSWNYKQLRGTSAQAEGIDRPEVRQGLGRLEDYDGGGAYRHENQAHADRVADLRLARHTLQTRRCEGQGGARMLAAGAVFEPIVYRQGHAQSCGAFTLLGVEQVISNDLGGVVADALRRPDLAQGGCRTRFSAVPADVRVVPPFVRRPSAPGVQSALVVGVDSEAITTERDARVKLQFHWQRGQRPNPGGLAHPGRLDGGNPPGNAPGNEASGTWVRVAQRAAGANWGTLFTPRVGTEVLVDFIDADIDRPLVVGQLHNGQDTPPFAAGVGSGANHPGVLSGVHSASLDRSGYNEWTIDDASGQLRMRLLCSYASSELGLGHLIRQGPAQAWRGPARGAGFEAGTQGWGSLRAGQGMLVSTSLRAGTPSGAESTQMDALEALTQLKAAQGLGERLDAAARTLNGHALATHAPGQALPAFIRSLDPAQDGKYDAPVNGQEPRKADAQRRFTDPVERPATPSIVLDSASALALVSEAGIAGFAGQDQAWVSQGDWHEAAGHTTSLVAGGTASWVTHDGGFRIEAAHGPVSLRAHTDRLEILADQGVQVLSVNDEITISAATRIELVGGDSKVVLDGGDIDFVTPGSFTVRAAMHGWAGAGRSAAVLQHLPSGLVTIPPQKAQFRYACHDGEPARGAHYTARFGDGSVKAGALDAQGFVQLDEVKPGNVELTLGPDPRSYEQFKLPTRPDDHAHTWLADGAGR